MFLNRKFHIIKKSKLFDANYYLRNYPDVRKADIEPLKHFVKYGYLEGRNPSENFCTSYYQEKNPDVKESGLNPLVHYILYGKKEGRQPIRLPEKQTNQPSEIEAPGIVHPYSPIPAEQTFDATEIERNSRVPGFHLCLPLNLQISNELTIHPRINVILPSLQLKDMSGGPNTALLLAALLAEQGEQIRLISCGVPGEMSELFQHMDKILKRPVKYDKIELVDAVDRTHETFIGVNDIFLATAWWTAQIVKYAMRKTVCKTFIYLIQDFEPILHNGSTFQARALETYSLSHIPVINTRLLLDHLISEKAGCYTNSEFAENALCFEPALDQNCFYPDQGKKESKHKRTLLFYARPTFAHRNLFEIGVVALKQAVASGAIDRENWEIWAMGEKLEPVDLGNGVFLNPLPWMSFQDYTKRVRTADLLLSLMLSPHPSYPPLEMAASGKLVVTNSFSVKTPERLRQISPNIIVTPPTAEKVAIALTNAVSRINAGFPSYDPTGKIGLPANWDESMKEIVPNLLQRINKLRWVTTDLDSHPISGFPYTPKTAYETYRRSSLTRRRQDGKYHQEPELLSFVTSAYNTNPVFLEELAHSILLQDGGTHFEWFILDNGSTNKNTQKTLQVISRHPSVRLKRVKKNLGIIGGMRFCLEHARGRYILPLDSDDIIEPDCVHVLTRFIKENNYPPLLYTDEDKLVEGNFCDPYFKPDWDPVLFLHSCYIAHLCAIDRELGLQLGIYSDKSSEGCHDWDSFIRFMNAGHIPQHISEVLYSWRTHKDSTASGNVASKSFISNSHQATLQRFLKNSGNANIELVNSPFFTFNVDWCFQRKHVNPKSIQTIIIKINNNLNDTTKQKDAKIANPKILNTITTIQELDPILKKNDTELIHIYWQDVVPDNDEWQWDAMALIELFSDVVMVGGALHDGRKVVDGPSIFGFGEGFDSPDNGRMLSDPGYSAKMWKPHTVSSVPSAHCVIKTNFLKECLKEIPKNTVPINLFGVWLGALAREAGNRVIYSPFMRAQIDKNYKKPVLANFKEHFLSRFWGVIPDSRVYSSKLGLDSAKAYMEVSQNENKQHMLTLQSQTMQYHEWLKLHIQRRKKLYPIPKKTTSISLITTVYEKTNLDYLDELAKTVSNQILKATQWIIVAHGPIVKKSIEHIKTAAKSWQATVIVEAKPLEIMGAMRRGLESAHGDYIVPIDADDLITSDAIQILTNAISALKEPDLIFSDEDLLVDGQPAFPYLRSKFDPVLNLDSSYIWHLCAISRKKAIDLELYTDADATWCHDWDSVMRMSNAGARIEHIPEVLYHWRQHCGSTTNNTEGDSRSLDSVRHILNSQKNRIESKKNFHISEWPENRGVKELYIRRNTDELPQFIWIDDAITNQSIKYHDNAIIVFVANGVQIKSSQQVFSEVARLFELHPQVGIIGGLVEGNDGLVVDGCYMMNNNNMLESPWHGHPANHAGPYALALKTQYVSTTGNSLAFFRLSALKQTDSWPLKKDEDLSGMVMQICAQIAKNNWHVAFSPLVRAFTNIKLAEIDNSICPPTGIPKVIYALMRYGMSLNYKS